MNAGRTAWVLTTALAVAFSLRPIDDFDVWFHLAAGRLIWATHHWPLTNTFSYTAPDHPWVDVHWLFQLSLYAAHSAFGPNGCIGLAVVCVLVTLRVLVLVVRPSATSSVAALLLVWALAIASPRFVPRPELVGFALQSSFLWLLERRGHRASALYWMVPLQILWMNTHGTVPLGPLLIGCYWLGATAARLRWVPDGWREASAPTTTWPHLTAVTILVALACFATPWGLEGARLPTTLLGDVAGATALSTRIGEFRPPFQSGLGFPLASAWAVLLAVALASFLFDWRRVHLGRLLAVATLGVLSTRAVRNVAPFALLAAPVVALNTGSLRIPVLAARGVRLLVPLLIASLLWAVTTNRFARALGVEREVGVGVSGLHAPIEALRFAEAVGITGRPFNCLASGGYLAWERFPGERVFIDGRTQAYPVSFFDEYFRVMDDPEAWPGIVSRYAPDYVLLYHVWPNRHPLARYLADGHGWTLAYYDPTASIYLPTDEAHRDLREKAARTFASISDRVAAPAGDPWPQPLAYRLGVVPVAEIRRQTAFGDFLLNVGHPREAVTAYERALTLDGDVAATRYALGLAHWTTGSPGAAIADWEETLRRAPDFAAAREALSELATLRATP